MIYTHDPSTASPSMIDQEMDVHSLQERVEAAANQALNNSFNRRGDYIGIDMDDADSDTADGSELHRDPEPPRGGISREHSTVDSTTNLRESYNQLRIVVNQHESGQTILTAFAAVLPFVMLFTTKLLFDNIVILTIILLAYSSFLSLNGRIQELSYSTSARTSIGYKALLCVWALATAAMTAQNCVAVGDFDTFKALSFQYSGANYHGFLDTLLFVILLDVFMKAATCFFKLVILFLPTRLIAHHFKRNIFQCIEYFSQCYRCALPITPWLCYFLGADRSFGEAEFSDLALAILYLVCKSRELVAFIKAFVECGWRVFTVVPFGAVPTRNDIEKDNMCAVCHDEFTNPTKLKCDHIFCLSCIERWLESTETCPVCRAVVEKANNQFKSGATSKLPRIY